MFNIFISWKTESFSLRFDRQRNFSFFYEKGAVYVVMHLVVETTKKTGR